MGYDLDIKTCAKARKWIAAQTGIPIKDITVDHGHRKIIITVKTPEMHVFRIKDTPFIYTITDDTWQSALTEIQAVKGRV